MVALGPRPAGSPRIRQTRAYITRQLIERSASPCRNSRSSRTTPLGPVEMVNLIVTLPGRRPDRILVTGHYDTKLFRDRASSARATARSSAAFLIELARVLKDRPHEFTYELVWFDGEEAVRRVERDRPHLRQPVLRAGRHEGRRASLQSRR